MTETLAAAISLVLAACSRLVRRAGRCTPKMVDSQARVAIGNHVEPSPSNSPRNSIGASFEHRNKRQRVWVLVYGMFE